MTICNLTAQQLRRAAAIKDEIDELTKALMAIAEESLRGCARVATTGARSETPVSSKPRIAAPIAPAASHPAGELPAPSLELELPQAPKTLEEQPSVPTAHVTNGLHPTPNSQLTDEQNQSPGVYLTEGQQQPTTITATSTEASSNQENLDCSIPAVVPAKWEVQRLLQEVARVIAEHPEKVPALKTAGIPALTNEYLREATELVAKLDFTAEERYASLWELGKNVTQDEAVLPAINRLGMRNLGDLLGKLNELGFYANRRGQMLIIARLWSLAGVRANPADTKNPLAQMNI